MQVYSRYKTLFIVCIALLLLGIGYVVYHTQIANTETDIAKKEATMIKTMLSKHLVLPEGEEPDIRKINQKLEDPFFANANVGDYLIIFYKS